MKKEEVVYIATHRQGTDTGIWGGGAVFLDPWAQRVGKKALAMPPSISVSQLMEPGLDGLRKSPAHEC